MGGLGVKLSLALILSTVWFLLLCGSILRFSDPPSTQSLCSLWNPPLGVCLTERNAEAGRDLLHSSIKLAGHQARRALDLSLDAGKDWWQINHAHQGDLEKLYRCTYE